MKSYHVGVAAEAFAAGLFARCGLDVSVQYGANQPEYDLVVARGDDMLKVSVKGSQDGGWGLTQSFLKNADYHSAVDHWLARHRHRTVLCLVQFYGVQLDALPRVYLATPTELSVHLKSAAGGRGDSILNEDHTWSKRAKAAGTRDRVPESWRFSLHRIEELFILCKHPRLDSNQGPAD